jgi:hypothetical protein
MTKKEAVRRALARLGRDAKPAAIQPFVKKEFGIDMTAAHITTAKGEILRKAAKGKPGPKKAAPSAPKAAAPAATAPTRAPAASKAGNASGVALQDLQAVKDLVGRVGAESLRSLIDLFAR